MKAAIIAGCVVLSVLTTAPGAHADYCAIVKKTNDGFLAVRKEPTVKGEMIAAIRADFPVHISSSNQFLEADEQFFDKNLPKNWTKWVFVSGWFSTGDAEPSHGWVYGKYLKKVPCEGPEFRWWKE
jgi:hypothetical protein